MSDKFEEGCLVEIFGNGYSTVWGHSYKGDNRNPSYSHPLGFPARITIPPSPQLFNKGLKGMIIKSLPMAKGWHQGGDIDYIVLIGDELCVLPDWTLRILK